MEFMKKSFSNYKEVTLTVWPTTAKERKGSFEICMNVRLDVEVNPGDEVLGGGNNEALSVYTIEAIVEKRPAAVQGYAFIRAKVKWSSRNFAKA